MARRGERVERSGGAAPPRQHAAAATSAEGDLLTLRVESDGATVISIAGELDLSTIPMVEGRLFAELGSHPGVVVDLTGLRFIDSSGIGLLIQVHRSATNGGAMHAVVAAGSQVDRVLRLVGIDRVLPLFVDRDEAIAALNGGGP